MAKEFLFSYEDELNWSLIHVETVVPADASASCTRGGWDDTGHSSKALSLSVFRKLAWFPLSFLPCQQRKLSNTQRHKSSFHLLVDNVLFCLTLSCLRAYLYSKAARKKKLVFIHYERFKVFFLLNLCIFRFFFFLHITIFVYCRCSVNVYYITF